MSTVMRGYRMPAETLEQIADLSKAWGGIKASTATAVIVEAVRRAHDAEARKAKKLPRKSSSA